jgi:putative sterol carrier protein
VGCKVLGGGPGGEDVHIRLDGAEGIWHSFKVGDDPKLLSGAVFTLSGDLSAWQDIVSQQLHPLRGLILGRLRLHGQLSALLRWAQALEIMAELAGTVDTTWADGDERP